MYYTYVILSKKNVLYKGISSDPERRLVEHNQGKNPSTRKGVPWKLILVERFLSRAQARSREKYLKSGQGREYLKNLINPR